MPGAINNRKNSTVVALDRYLDLFDGVVGLNPGLDLAGRRC